MDILDEEILQLWRLLHLNQVKYIMVGGFATNFHGFSRFTADLDIWLEDSLANRQKFRHTISQMEIGDFPQLETMDFVAGWTSITLLSGLELDVMTQLHGFEKEKFDSCYDVAQKATIEDVEVVFLHINHLITEKKACSRPKDLLDLEELEKIRDQKAE
jgi:hypothetical protein